MSKSVLILGAKSDIAKATAMQFAKNGFNLILVGRDVKSELNEFSFIITQEFEQKVFLHDLDILDKNATDSFLSGVEIIPEGIISFIGLLGEQRKAINDPSHAEIILTSNFNAIVPILDYFAIQFENRSSGFIVGVSSVAGARGRKSNYYYGAAKAAFTAYLSGLRNRLFQANVHVVTVVPGYVETKMTHEMSLPKWLMVSPIYVGEKIFNAHKNKKDLLYVPGFWKIIMAIISLIPERIFKKLDL